MSRDVARIRVLLADDHPAVREGLRALLTASQFVEIVGEAANGAAACELARALQPDVLVVDIDMPVVDGVQTTARVRHECPGTKVLALTVHSEPNYIRRVINAGGAGYVLKQNAAKALVRAIKLVHGGRTCFDAARVPASIPPTRHRPLT